MLSYFIEKIDKNNYIYSIDMIRLRFELNEKIIEVNNKFDDLLSNFSFIIGCCIKRYISKSGLGYHYLYNCNIEDNNFNKCSFTLGLGLNCLQDKKNIGFIEFNPNKTCNFKVFNDFLNNLKALCSYFELVRYDIAIDIPEKRSNVKMVRSLKCNYEFLNGFYKDGVLLNNSVTEYQGRRSHNKFTKLYDKTKESKLDYDLTRIEFTLDREEVSFKNLPNFLIMSDFKFDLSNNDKLFLFLLLQSDDLNYYLKNLSRRKREKFEPYLHNCYINIDFELILDLRDFVLNYEFH